MSGVISSIKSTKQYVMNYLKYHKLAKIFRDNDRRLVARFWSDELSRMKPPVDPKQISGYDLLKIYAEGKLTSHDVITRARRKAQEDDKELRGDNWKNRQDEEEEVRDAFRNDEI